MTIDQPIIATERKVWTTPSLILSSARETEKTLSTTESVFSANSAFGPS